METGSIYDITIEPVDMSGHYTLMFVVCGILLIGGATCAVITYVKTRDDKSGGVIVGSLVAFIGLMLLILWGYVGISNTMDETVNSRVEQQLESSISLTQIMTTGSSIYDGFVAVDSDGQAVRGIIKKTGHDQYKVFLYDYK